MSLSHSRLKFTHADRYHVRPISYEEYLSACGRLEDQIFGNYFGFSWANSAHGKQANLKEKFTETRTTLYQIILGIFYHEELVGWHYTVQQSPETVLMKDTGLLPQHQNKGVYSALLPQLLAHIQEKGFEKVLSYHRSTNNQVILPKLRAGFYINGFTVDDYGLAVELLYAFDPVYRDCLRVRSGEIRPHPSVSSRLGLTSEHIHE